MGDRLTSGDIYAVVHENSLLDHRMCVPPGARGNVTFIAPPGDYTLTDKVLELEFGGVKKVRARDTHAWLCGCWPDQLPVSKGAPGAVPWCAPLAHVFNAL